MTQRLRSTARCRKALCIWTALSPRSSTIALADRMSTRGHCWPDPCLGSTSSSRVASHSWSTPTRTGVLGLAGEHALLHVMHVIFRVISDSLDGLSFVTMGACRACWGFAAGLFG